MTVNNEREKRLVTFVAMEPDEEICAKEIRDAARRRMATPDGWRLDHGQGQIVESHIAGRGEEIGGHYVPEGSWVITAHVADDEQWNKIKAGEYTAVSIDATDLFAALRHRCRWWHVRCWTKRAWRWIWRTP